jgi:uncharacterized 2Fe-2S/4Fe-4S cluster protein (DUF4445 family)
MEKTSSVLLWKQGFILMLHAVEKGYAESAVLSSKTGMAMEAGVHINASCGGEGVCGKCRVIIEDGNVEGGITENLSKEDLKKGYRQACLSYVKSDLVVRIPTKSTIDASALNMQSTPHAKTGCRYQKNRS